MYRLSASTPPMPLVKTETEEVDMHRNLLALAGAGIVSLIGTAALFRRLR